MRMAASLFPQLDDYTELTVVCPSGEYSASAIAHAVEDADAHLLNLNVVAGTQPNSPTTVILRVKPFARGFGGALACPLRIRYGGNGRDAGATQRRYD